MALVLAAGCGLAGCEGVPTEEADQARRGVEQARQAEADKYAAEEFAQLTDSLRVGRSPPARPGEQGTPRAGGG